MIQLSSAGKRLPRFCRCCSPSVRAMPVRHPSSYLIPGQALADDLRCGLFEAVEIVHILPSFPAQPRLAVPAPPNAVDAGGVDPHGWVSTLLAAGCIEGPRTPHPGIESC